MDTFLYTGAAFGMVLGASILPLRRRGAIEKWLMGSLLIIGALATASITLQHGLSSVDQGGVLELFEIGTGFAVGPLLFLFCLWRNGSRSSGRSVAIHFAPAVTVGVMILLQGRYVMPISIMVFHQALYSVVSLRVVLVRRASRGLDVWSLRLCVVALSINAAQVVRMAFTDVEPLRNVVPLTIVGGFATLALLGLRQLLDSSLSRSARPGYERSGLDAEAAAQMEQRLSVVMESERPWLDPELSLDRLAARIEASPHHLSELLNVYIGSSFHELVTRERLEEAKRRLADSSNDIYTIEAIAEGAGFPSRSSFYTAFRRAFGMTPTQFRRQARRGRE